jgi:hypothetical protein
MTTGQTFNLQQGAKVDAKGPFFQDCIQRVFIPALTILPQSEELAKEEAAL